MARIKTIIAFDLGTGGVKASLYGERAEILAKAFAGYDTHYEGADVREQRPESWWDAVAACTRKLLADSGRGGGDVACVSLSGHSLVAVPVDADGRALLDRVPIWSDARAGAEAAEFFARTGERGWYMATGNGFPPPCYTLFKLMWMKKHQPAVFSRIFKVLGSKDYINFKLTGAMYTDHSYASGTGAYDLAAGKMKVEYLEAAGIPANIFPEIVQSDRIIGGLTKEAAEALGLREGAAVTCGGVDNACMALGAASAREGGCYASLGSSSWIAVTSSKPVLDARQKPYVFAHIEPGMYTSAFSIFSGGSSLKWALDNLFADLSGGDAFARLDEIASAAPIGGGGVLFVPSLAGGTSQDKSPHVRGAFLNLSLGATRADLARAAMEGIAFSLKASMLSLGRHAALSGEMLFCGGGSKSPFWMQMFADVFDMPAVKSDIDQDAASLGAAAAAFKALGIWKDYGPVAAMHTNIKKYYPAAADAEKYGKIFHKFVYANDMMSDLGEYLHAQAD